MANIIDNLDILNTNLDNAKFKIAKNLKDKGVQALPSDKLDTLADKIVDIPSGSCNLQELNVVENGVYTPQAGDVKGYNKVTVNVPSSGGGDLDARWKEIGYDKEPEYINEGIAYAKEIQASWDASQTNLESKFIDNKRLVYMPLVDTSKANYMKTMFKGCESLVYVYGLDFSNVSSYSSELFAECGSLKSVTLNNYGNKSDYGINLYMAFYKCHSITHIKITNNKYFDSMHSAFRECENLTTLEIENFDVSRVADFSNIFDGCKLIKTIKLGDISNSTNFSFAFQDCKSLETLILLGNPSKITNMEYMFGQSSWSNLKPNGTLVYDYRYDYSKVIDELHKYNPTWAAKPSYEAQECTSLSITADDVIGNVTTTTVHYTAMTNGINSLTGEMMENVEVKGDAVSEDFGENPSYDTSRQVTVTFNYLGQTATTTITQSAKLPPTATVDLMDNWELAPNETIPNPDSQIYEGVYQSIHKGQGNVKDKMVITLLGMPNFELYIRSYAESGYDYVFAGKLDQAEPTERNNQASTKDNNQQAGTDLASYTKVEYPNDGGQHTITVVYRKDGGGNSGDDRGYVFFTKPQA